MRFWPMRRRPTPASPPPDDLILVGDMLRRNLDDVLAVYDNGEKNGVFLFRGQLILAPARALELLRERFERFGYTPYLRKDRQGGVLLQAWPTVTAGGRSRVAVNVVLFVLTLISVLWAGMVFYVGSPTFDALRRDPGWWWLSGVPFGLTLLATLTFHEFGHYFAARYYGVPVSLPYFIPVPPPFIFGTLGAVIRMRGPATNKNSLFDIAAAGPLAGLVIAVPALVLGVLWSTVAPATSPFTNFGDSILTHGLVMLWFGALPDGMRLYTHPVFDAAWAGLFVTALNLTPIGQLDGGRIVYAVFGRAHRFIGITAFTGLLALGATTWSLNWIVWALFVLAFVGFGHSPPLDDMTPLTRGRRLIGIACMLLLIVILPPVPLPLSFS